MASRRALFSGLDGLVESGFEGPLMETESTVEVLGETRLVGDCP